MAVVVLCTMLFKRYPSDYQLKKNVENNNGETPWTWKNTKYSHSGLMSHRIYRSVRYQRWCCTDTGTNFSADVHTGTGVDIEPTPVPTWVQTSIPVPEVPIFVSPVFDVIPVLPKCSVPVLMPYRTCRSVPGTGIDVVPNLLKCLVPVLMSCELTEVSGYGNTGGTYRRYVRHVPYWTHPWYFVLVKDIYLFFIGRYSSQKVRETSYAGYSFFLLSHLPVFYVQYLVKLPPFFNS